MRDAGEIRAHLRAEQRRVADAVLDRWRTRPRELRVGAVVDLRVANAHVRALREPMLVAEVELLGSGVADMGAVVHSDDPFQIAGLRVRRPDRTLPDRDRERDSVLLRLDVAVRLAKCRPSTRGRHCTGRDVGSGKWNDSAFVRHALHREPNVDYTEVPAALDGPASVSLARRGEVLVLVIRRADARPAAHAGPLHRRGPHRRIRSRRADGRLALVGLVQRLDLHAAEDRRLVGDRLGSATPERMTHAAASWQGIANRNVGGERAGTRSGALTAHAVVLHGGARRLPTADDPGHWTPGAPRADSPKCLEVSPRRRPLTQEDVTEAALDTDSGVT